MTHSTPADRLREERTRLGLSQSALADACALQRETWSRYEAGKLSPGMEVLAALTTVGVDVLYVLTGSRSFVPPDPLSPREAVLLDNYRRAGDAGQRAIESTAAALAAGAPAPSRKQVFHGPVTAVAGRDVREVHHHGAPKTKKAKAPSDGGA